MGQYTKDSQSDDLCESRLGSFVYLLLWGVLLWLCDGQMNASLVCI